jgi:nucleoside-diphosphate-sugar epimerase
LSVTGAAGFIGANNVKALDQRGHRDILAMDPLNKDRVSSTQQFGRPDPSLFDV